LKEKQNFPNICQDPNISSLEREAELPKHLSGRKISSLERRSRNCPNICQGRKISSLERETELPKHLSGPNTSSLERQAELHVFAPRA
jgi:hypothetical protein